MRILRKTHFWQDKRTFLELNAELPFLKDGYPREGNVILRIGEDNSTKGAFKMGIDEARALRDVLDHFIREHDAKMKDLHNSWTPSSTETTSSEIVLNEPVVNEPQPTLSSNQQPQDNSFSFNETQSNSQPSLQTITFDEPKQEQPKNDFDIFGEKPKNETKLQPLF